MINKWKLRFRLFCQMTMFWQKVTFKYVLQALESLRQIPDGSIDDIDFPSGPFDLIPDINIKEEGFYDSEIQIDHEPEIDVKNNDIIENCDKSDSRLPFNDLKVTSLKVKNDSRHFWGFLDFMALAIF